MHTRLICGLLALAGLSSGSVWAQRNVTPTGRIMDANPSVIEGSANGYRAQTPLMRGNLIGSGNVRFGQSLRISSPVGDPSTFSAGLPSSGLSSFIRDSFGGADPSLSSESYFTPYFDPGRTAPTASLLNRQGAYGVGGSRFESRDPLARPTAIPGMLESARALESPSPLTLSTRDRAPFPSATALDSSIFGPTTGRRPTALSLSESIARTGQEPARPDPTRFGTLPDPGRTPRALDRDDLSEQIARSDGRTPIDLSTPQQPIASDWRQGTDILSTRSNVGLAFTQMGPAILQQRSAELAARELSPGLSPVAIGQDLFTDMQLALELERNPNADWYAEMVAAQNAGDTGRSAELSETAAADAAAFRERVLATPIRTLAGPTPSPLNDALSEAEHLLNQGRFYDASQAYSRAAIVDPSNPLPVLGQAHALLAAGEYRSAATTLQNAVRRFPELARFSSDLTSLMGSGETVDIRRADLINMLERGEDAELRFLLGYIELNGGQRERGLDNLRKAAAAAPPGSLIARYPDMLRGDASGGSPPASAPSVTQPPQENP